MSFARVFKFLTVMIALAVSFTLAASQHGRVRSVLGDVSYQKKGKDNWPPLRVGAKLQEGDVIKTDVESAVLISMPDGSTISIEENALVVFEEVKFSKSTQITDIEIVKGMICFDAQKQKGKNSKFRFKTGTATASIRGTDGAIGLTESGQPYGSLNSGEMVMERSGKEVTVKPQQYVAFRKDSEPVVVAAKNASDPEFVKKMGEAVDDTTKSVESIQSQAKELDQKIEKRNEELRSKYQCKIAPYPSVVVADSAEIYATCTAGVRVSIGSESVLSDGHSIRFTPSWTSGAYGMKKFLVNCSVDKNTFECGRVSFEYRKDRGVEIHESDSVKCIANYKTFGYEDNEGALEFFYEDSLVQKFVMDRDTVSFFKLQPGVHDYTVKAENVNKLVGTDRKRLPCYPVTGVKAVIRGDAKAVFKKKLSQGYAVYPTVEFDLLKVANNDPEQIKSVSVMVGDESYETKFIPSQQGLGYSAKVKIQRGGASVLKVVVTMKSGEVATATKTYEFR